MPASQKSYETRFGRFLSAYEILKGNSEYDPLNALITKDALNTFIADLRQKDELVNKTYLFYREKARIRRENGFKGKNNLENCLENRLRLVLAYIGGEIGRSSSAYKIIKDFIKKLRPKYKKKSADALRGEGKSPSEQSFVALIGYGIQTVQIIEDMGAAYNPGNTDIQPLTLKNFCEWLEDLTSEIATAETQWAEAVRIRLELYDGKNGMADRIVLIKDYLASFQGGKKNQNYIEFDRIIKGK